jgi:glutathione S-transferase
MIVVHHLNNSRSQRVLWLLEELRVEYESSATSAMRRRCSRRPSCATCIRSESPGDLRRRCDDRRVRRDHRIPGQTSTATGDSIPAHGTPERLRYTYWMHFRRRHGDAAAAAEARLRPIEKAPAPVFRAADRAGDCEPRKEHVRPAEHRRNLDYMEAELAKYDWFAGNEFTAADVQMSFPLEAAAARGGLDSSRRS